MKKTFLIILIALSFIPSISKAEDKYTLLEPLPCISGVGDCAAGTIQPDISINNYILYVYKFSIALAIFLAIVMIIWGGFLYITSEVPFIKSDGKSKIQNAVTGLIMVLVSYLILQTIDPRLVNIDANIPAIKVDPKAAEELKNYNEQLVSDLRKVNSENQIKFNEINNNIADLQKQKAGVDGRQANGEIATKEEADLQKKDLDQQIKNAQIERAALLAENSGASSFANAIDIINNPEGGADNLNQYKADQTPNTKGNELRPVNSPNVIQNQYNEKINEIIKSNSNFDKIPALEKQRDFYISQVKDIKTLKEVIDVTDLNAQEKKLPEKLKAYQADQKDSTKAAASGLPQDQYEKVIQSKINMVNEELNKNP